MTDITKVQEFAKKILGIYTGGMLTKMIDIGNRTGLFEASSGGPVTSSSLSKKTGLHERYVREWLASMATSGIFEYEAESELFSLPEEHAMLLTGSSSKNLSPTSRMINELGLQLPALTEAFKTGGGIPYSAYRPDFTHSLDEMWKRVYSEQLVEGFIGQYSDIVETLENGIKVLDVGCGTGRAINVLAKTFPNSSFFGYDIAEDGIALAKQEARDLNLSNINFDVIDVTKMPENDQFDLIIAVDTIHDLPFPEMTLKKIYGGLSENGVFLMIEFKFKSNVEGNLNNPFAPLYYGFSLLHCTPVSIAAGGPGLGCVWGEEVARKMLAEAGFNKIVITDTPRPQNYMFHCSR